MIFLFMKIIDNFESLYEFQQVFKEFLESPLDFMKVLWVSRRLYNTSVSLYNVSIRFYETSIGKILLRLCEIIEDSMKFPEQQQVQNKPLISRANLKFPEEDRNDRPKEWQKHRFQYKAFQKALCNLMSYTSLKSVRKQNRRPDTSAIANKKLADRWISHNINFVYYTFYYKTFCCLSREPAWLQPTSKV